MGNVTLPYTFINGTVADAVQVDADFNALVTAHNANTRTILTTATTFYVSTTGSDTVTGLDPSHPAATVNYILDLLQSTYDLNGQTVTIQLAGGTYTQNILVEGMFLGAVSGSSTTPVTPSLGSVIVQGNVGSPSSVVLIGTISVHYGAALTLQGLTLQNLTGTAAGVEAYAYALMTLVNCNWNANALIQAVSHGTVWLFGSHTINANASASGFLWAHQNSTIYVAGTFTVAAGVTVPTFASADHCSLVYVLNSASFAGTNTGARFNAARNSYIYFEGASPFPGVAPADANCQSGGRYHGPDGNFPSVFQVSS